MADPSLLLVCLEAAASSQSSPPCDVQTHARDAQSGGAVRSLSSSSSLVATVSAPETLTIDRRTSEKETLEKEALLALRSEGSAVNSSRSAAPTPVPESMTTPQWSASGQTSGQTSSQTSGQASSQTSAPILRLGSRGQMVRKLQQQLQRLGYSLDIDGIYGSRTQAIVLQFQHAKNLKPDGVVGQQTWAQLLAASSLSQAAAPSTSQSSSDRSSSDRSSSDQSTDTAVDQATNRTTNAGNGAASTANTTDAPNPTDPSDHTTQPDPATAARPANSEEPVEAPIEPESIPIEATEPAAPELESGTNYQWIALWAVIYMGGWLLILRGATREVKMGKVTRFARPSTRSTAATTKTIQQSTTQQSTTQQSTTQQSTPVASVRPVTAPARPIAATPNPAQVLTTPALPLPVISATAIKSVETVESAETESVAAADRAEMVEAVAQAEAAKSSANSVLKIKLADEGVVYPLRNLYWTPGTSNLANFPERQLTRILQQVKAKAENDRRAEETSNSHEATVVTLPFAAHETADFTYSLVNDANGLFILRGNELRVMTDRLQTYQSDSSVITLRRTDAQGVSVDKSYRLEVKKMRQQVNMEPVSA